MKESLKSGGIRKTAANSRAGSLAQSASRLLGKVKTKRILALIGVALLVGLYVASLVFALLDSPMAKDLLTASIVASVFVPVMLFVFNLVHRMVKK